jgi:hypothetical protein
MYILPLAPHDESLVLYDPLVLLIGGEHFLMDLCFSGHTSYIFLMALRSEKFQFTYYLSMSVLMVMLLWTRAHYTIDIFMALSVSITVNYFVQTIVLET